jgi:hypothetical protein
MRTRGPAFQRHVISMRVNYCCLISGLVLEYHKYLKLHIIVSWSLLLPRSACDLVFKLELPIPQGTKRRVTWKADNPTRSKNPKTRGPAKEIISLLRILGENLSQYHVIQLFTKLKGPGPTSVVVLSERGRSSTHKTGGFPLLKDAAILS